MSNNQSTYVVLVRLEKKSNTNQSFSVLQARLALTLFSFTYLGDDESIANQTETQEETTVVVELTLFSFAC
jgi:hypothetical protein